MIDGLAWHHQEGHSTSISYSESPLNLHFKPNPLSTGDHHSFSPANPQQHSQSPYSVRLPLFAPSIRKYRFSFVIPLDRLEPSQPAATAALLAVPPAHHLSASIATARLGSASLRHCVQHLRTVQGLPERLRLGPAAELLHECLRRPSLRSGACANKQVLASSPIHTQSADSVIRTDRCAEPHFPTLPTTNNSDTAGHYLEACSITNNTTTKPLHTTYPPLR
ncbi:hypothetical protein BDV96DRAFT_298341 [Lophiotrema nucula]|uniref:Uncharacterized protein n=1 Tax=Lophiotrema nucula TaxID=690887 RepID=A0A6A5YLM3_9PLEO|nr:hypothetical protein BDV96DRAFT_298341 [Lophiotrema nucula]